MSYKVDFENDEIMKATRRNQFRLNKHLQDIYEAGEFDRDPRALTNVGEALAAVETAPGYRAVVDSMSPELYASTQVSTLFSAMTFGDALMSCARRSGAMRFIAEGSCVWFQPAGYRRFMQDDDGAALGFDETVWSISGGRQHRIAEDQHLGWGLSYERRSLSMNSPAKADGGYFQAGLVYKRRFDATLLSALLSGGFGDFDADRLLFTDERASGSQDVWNVSGRLRATRSFGFGDWSLKPRLDLAVDHVGSGEVHESGSRALGLNIASEGNTFVSLAGAVEFVGEIALGGDLLLRPSATIGVTRFVGGDVPAVTARFAQSPGEVNSFRVNGDFDRTYLDAEIGFSLIDGDGLNVELAGVGALSENTRSYGGRLRVEIPF